MLWLEECLPHRRGGEGCGRGGPIPRHHPFAVRYVPQPLQEAEGSKVCASLEQLGRGPPPLWPNSVSLHTDQSLGREVLVKADEILPVDITYMC